MYVFQVLSSAIYIASDIASKAVQLSEASVASPTSGLLQAITLRSALST